MISDLEPLQSRSFGSKGFLLILYRFSGLENLVKSITLVVCQFIHVLKIGGKIIFCGKEYFLLYSLFLLPNIFDEDD
jgi:hypothetical protein